MMQEEVNEATSVLSVYGHTIKVTEVLQDGDTLTFIIVSQKLSGTGEYHVDRTYEDFEWLQQHLYAQEDVPGLQGVIFPPLPVRPQVNASAKVMKQLGFLGLGEWQPYCKALETFLRQVAAHSILSKNKTVEVFLTSTDPPGRQKLRRNIFNRLSQAVEGLWKEGHKDVDEFFHTERDHNLVLTGHTRTATEKFLDVVLTEQKSNHLGTRGEPSHALGEQAARNSSSSCATVPPSVNSVNVVCDAYEIAVACGHFAAALHICVENGEDPEKKAFSRVCVKLSEVFDSIKKNMTSIAVNDINTLGLGLDLDSRYLEAEKEMLFRRTCKLVELENARKNAERAKPVKKNAMEEVKKAAEGEFEQICKVAKQEIVQLNQERVEMLQKNLIQWCEQQLQTAKEGADAYNQHLQGFIAMA